MSISLSTIPAMFETQCFAIPREATQAQKISLKLASLTRNILDTFGQQMQECFARNESFAVGVTDLSYGGSYDIDIEAFGQITTCARENCGFEIKPAVRFSLQLPNDVEFDGNEELVLVEPENRFVFTSAHLHEMVDHENFGSNSVALVNKLYNLFFEDVDFDQERPSQPTITCTQQ